MNNQQLPSRILEIPPDQYTPEQRAGVDALLQGRGRLLTPYKVWLYSPELLRVIEQFGTFLNKKSSLSEREVELGICLIAHHWKSEYVFRVHAARCLKLGYPPAVIDAIRDNKAPDLPNLREQAVYARHHGAVESGQVALRSFRREPQSDNAIVDRHPRRTPGSIPVHRDS